MSMTREEVNKRLKGLRMRCQRLLVSSIRNPEEWRKDIAALDLALSALRPVSRERVEKVWRGCSWCNNEGKKPENWECSLLDDRGFSVVAGDEVVWTNAEFCPVCGKPLTDWAVQIVMERLGALHENRD